MKSRRLNTGLLGYAVEAMKTLSILGSHDQCGAYLLRLHVRCDVAVRFGRFQGGRAILVPKGDVVYVGSAMAQRGSMALARRLLRHATRHDAGNPQRIRGEMLRVFKKVGLGAADLQPPGKKKLFWNIDYLLEEEAVDLSHVVVVRTGLKLEEKLARFLEAEPNSRALAKGLGAHDSYGRTHVFLIQETADWWRQLPYRVEGLLGD
jgi:Uri superfamily endonuclease